MQVNQMADSNKQRLLFDDASNRSIKKMTDPTFMNPPLEDLERKYAKTLKQKSPEKPYQQLEMASNSKTKTARAVRSDQLTTRS